jgi:thioredoxin-like negative regulator of GroEL
MHLKVSDPKSAEQFTNESRKGYWIVLYYANWCPHCQVMKPEWQKFAEKYAVDKSINVAEVESENLSSVGEEHRQNVEGFPTIVCLNKGKPVSKYQGPRTSNDIDNFARDNYTSINGVTNAATNLNTILRSSKTSKGKGKSKSKSKGTGKGKKTKINKKKSVKLSQKTKKSKKQSSK